MSHPVKKVFFGSIFALCLLGSAWGQSTVSFTNSALSTGSFVNLSLSKFNQSLGTLTGVTVSLSFVTVSGQIVITYGTGPSTITGINNVASMNQASTNALGISLTSFTNALSVTPSPPQVVPEEDPLAFTVNPSPTNVLINYSTNIATNFWAAYSSADGSGVVTFRFRNVGDPQLTGSLVSADNSGLQGTGNMIVTYSYSGAEPIPEPSTVAAGAFLTVLAAASYWRRRRSTR